ncbi:MAG: pyruvate, phosphate dikinase [Acidimicrobiia bacterium]
MTYVYAYDHPPIGSHDEVVAIIGGKAANIGVMARELGLPVPPAFTLSTFACRDFLAAGWPPGLEEEISEHMSRLETAVGRHFGDSADPLLVSVRSGAPVSMPGMMDTILNLGLNDATTAGFAAASGEPDFVATCRERFEATYREIVGVPEVPDDPRKQLRGAIEAVFRSWNSDRARAYRAHESIDDDLGTGVTVQAMVFGNRGSDSATGVVFTRNPATGENMLYGDVMFTAQGEDVVAGTHHTEPITVLDERMPDVAAELYRYADTLERHYSDVCDIEFTIEQHRLWMLQTRIGKRSPQAALRIAVEMAEDKTFPLSRAEAVARVAHHLFDPPVAVAVVAHDEPAVAVGLAASPGVTSGAIATSADEAVAMAEANREVILVRAETSPDDVHGMARAAGILTSTGGLASHAAVVARGWGIPAVVGTTAVRVGDGTVTIGDRSFVEGDLLTIDGGSGEIFAGCVTGSATIAPEAATLIAWADELGIQIAAPEERNTTMGEHDDIAMQPLSTGLAVRGLLIKGFVTPDTLAAAFQTTEEEAGALLDRLTADGLAELAGAMFKLTDDGRVVGTEMIATDQERWGAANAERALNAFVPLDGRIKVIVTAWQMRDVDGQPVLNDHTDAEYDAGVLSDLGTFHEDAATWIQTLCNGLPRLSTYVARLENAAHLVATGDHTYIASPRVDSYHNIWFELHEDLILLAGKTREGEVAAGRA